MSMGLVILHSLTWIQIILAIICIFLFFLPEINKGILAMRNFSETGFQSKLHSNLDVNFWLTPQSWHVIVYFTMFEENGKTFYCYISINLWTNSCRIIWVPQSTFYSFSSANIMSHRIRLSNNLFGVWYQKYLKFEY